MSVTEQTAAALPTSVDFRVQRGVAALDATVHDWVDMVNVETLRSAEVLEQLFPEDRDGSRWSFGLKVLGIPESVAWQYGLDGLEGPDGKVVGWEHGIGSEACDWQQLNQAWIHTILQRQQFSYKGDDDA